MMSIRFFTILLLLLLSPWSHAKDIPNFSASYNVNIQGLSAGELKQTLSTNDDGSYTFSSKTQTNGLFSLFKPDLVEEISIWQWQDLTIRPHSYHYARTGGKKEKFLDLKFDWDNQVITANNRKQSWARPVKANTLDKLVYQLAVMYDLAQKKDKLHYWITDGHKIKRYDIASKGEVIISLPLGKINTVKLIRSNKKKHQTTLWCAPQLHYLPVKIEHIEKEGIKYTAQLHQLEGIDTTTAIMNSSSIRHP